MMKSSKIGDKVYGEQLSIVTEMVLEQWVSCAHPECKAILDEKGITEDSTTDEIFDVISDDDVLKFQLTSFMFGQMTLMLFDPHQLKFYKNEAEKRLDAMLPDAPKF